ncbi:MAG: hypothetical protein QOK40_3267, partial [Miltoncostaeaceae bacterium]|nr:hypothetical protein [Miltoncostaeaceae bacterium]
ALVAALDGRRRRAARLLAASLAEAERQDARHERAQTLLARGSIGAALGWGGAAADIAAGKEAMAACAAVERAASGTAEEPITLSLADRFDTVLDAGRRIASALTPDAIYGAVREAALSLLRGQECLVVRVDSGQAGPELVAEDLIAGPRAQLSTLMAERSLQVGRPVVWADEPALDELSADVAAEGGVRSALCAPIFVRGRAAACFCVTHADVAALFGEDEARLAEFVATIAGAALENAEGFAEVAALSRSLERRVEERTTELAESNRALDASLQRLEALLESLSDGVVACDSEGRLTLFNRASREFHGVPVEALMPDQWAAHYELYTADGSGLLPVAEIPLMRALSGERLRDVEMVIGHRESDRRTVLASGQRIVDRDGNALGAVVALHDVTERKAAERGFEEATRRLESILGAAGEGICGLDPQGRISYANPAAARLTGYPVEQLIGRGLDELLSPEAPGRLDGRDGLAGQEPREDHAMVLRKDGTMVPAEYVRTGVDGDDGAGVVVMRDVSERRAVEQMKDEFVALASHELRTPLTSILGYLEVVLDEYDEELPREPRRLLRVAQRNARRLGDLVSDVLVAAQADAGRLRLDMGALDLQGLVLDCVEGARPAAEVRNLTLTVTAEPLGALMGDRGRLAQVLDNLISNALKFTAPGGAVQVTARREGGDVMIQVADTGMGIPERELDRLFTRFYRSSSAVRAAVPGTGLGLAITKMIVEGHGGRVEVESEEGVGSTFRVRLPVGSATP